MKQLLLGLCLLSLSLVNCLASVSTSPVDKTPEMRPAPVNDEGPGGGNTPPDKPKPKPAGNGTPQK